MMKNKVLAGRSVALLFVLEQLLLIPSTKNEIINLYIHIFHTERTNIKMVIFSPHINVLTII